MRISRQQTLVACLLVLLAGGRVTAIPEHPGRLDFPPLAYQPPDPAAHRVVLAHGPVAYLVPDRRLPLVNLVVLARAGEYLVPAGKEGLAILAGRLLAQGGCGGLTAEQLDERLDYLAAQVESDAGETETRVGLNLLSRDLDEGLALLRGILVAPRFQQDRIAQLQRELRQEMETRNDDPAVVEALERNRLGCGESFFVNRLPTAASVGSIGAADLRAYHCRWIHPGNLAIAASGDFDREALAAKLGKLFADWPAGGKPAPPVPAALHPAPPGVYLVDMALSQGRVSVLLPGLARDDPGFIPAMVMNDILGGGGFTSRVVLRVRSEEGLAYAAGSLLAEGDYYPPPFQAFLQTESRSVSRATSILLEEMRRIAAEPVAAEELETAKRGFIERFPNRFASPALVAEQFARDELSGRFARQPDYWRTLREKVAEVTAEDVQRAAARLLDPERAIILVVGDEKEILRGDPAAPVDLKGLGKGPYVRRPLRDPLTLEPRQAR